VLTHSTCAISGTAAASHIVNADMDRANHDNMEHDKIDQQQQQVKAASPLPFRLVSPSAAEFDPGEGVPPVLQIDRETGPPLKKNPEPEPVSSGHVSSDDEFEPAGVVDAMLPPKSRQDRLQQHSEIYLKTQGLLRCSCVGTGALVHFRCLPVEVRSAVSQCSTQAVYLNRSIAYACAKIAKICCDGAVQVDTLADGTSLMFQLVHCAAATAETASCCGVVPGYTFSIRQELRRTLSAAYHVLKASYATLLDSRTGADVLPWLLRGARLADGALDLSQFYAGILFAGTTVVSVACLRLLVDGIAEVPVLATRPELRSNRLGERLLARIESVLHKAGTRRIFTPAFAKPGLPCTALHVPGIDSGNVALDSAADTKVAGYVPSGPPLLMQSAWGYELASRTDMRDVAKTKMLRFPGVFLAVKRLCSSHDVLTPRSLPGSLKWNADIPWHATSALAAHDMVKILPKHQPDVANIFASAIPPSAPQATQQHENFNAPELTLVQQHFNEQLPQYRQDQGFGRAPKRSVLEQQRHVAVGTASAPLESVVVGFAPRRVAIPAVPAPCYSGKVVLDLNLQTQLQPHITVATQPNGLAVDGRGQHFGAPVAPHLQVASPDFMARQAALAQRLLAWQVAKRDGSGVQ
jgi:GNAT superfamily N-acetyltransferase